MGSFLTTSPATGTKRVTFLWDLTHPEYSVGGKLGKCREGLMKACGGMCMKEVTVDPVTIYLVTHLHLSPGCQLGARA